MTRRRIGIGVDVYDEAINRLIPLYADGHRLILSFSGGKDSATCLNLMLEAARVTNRLPVEVVTRDEEVAYPGTYEYTERVYHHPEVALTHLVAHQPIINVFNRAQPYWWVFDQTIPPEDWVRQPPSYAIEIPEQNIDSMTTPERFPPPPGKKLYSIVGLRATESRGRMYGVFSAGGYLTKPNSRMVYGVRPIYDWTDADVWKAHSDYKWDYNKAYDVLRKMGTHPHRLRIGPPTMNSAAVEGLVYASKAWPRWFDKVATRLPGIRLATSFGMRAVQPERRTGETWEGAFQRECIDTAPDWVAARSLTARTKLLNMHNRHSNDPFPEISPCYQCPGAYGCWKKLTYAMYNGDPFSLKVGILPYVEPEFFRKGAGYWGGNPAF